MPSFKDIILDKDTIIKILGTDKCPTCRENLHFFKDTRHLLTPNVKDGSIDLNKPSVMAERIHYFYLCREKIPKINNMEIGLFAHFRASFYSEQEYVVLRRVVHENNLYCAKLAVKEKIVHCNISKNGYFVANREKSYITVDNETLIDKIQSLMVLK